MSSFTPHPYQEMVFDFVLERIYSRGGAGVFLDPGLGKTLISLWVLETLKHLGEVEKTLIVAPKRVVYQVWPKEIEKWGFDLTYSIVHGPKKSARFDTPADVYLCTSDGVVWVEDQRATFDLGIIDESTAFKNWSSLRSKALRKINFTRTMVLTGTPASDKLGDIYPQVFLVDRGESLGINITRFRHKYQQPGGFEMRDWVMRPDMIPELYKAIAPCCIQLSAEDYLAMPELIENEIEVELPPHARKIYDDMEEELFAELDSLVDRTSEYYDFLRDDEGNSKALMALSDGGKYNTLRQIASGSAYMTDPISGERVPVDIHDEKLDALEELLDELNGKPLIVAYVYNHELAKIKKRFKGCSVINGETTGPACKKILNNWKAGKIRVLACQYKAMSHGIDGLQEGGSDICWFTLCDSGESHSQLNGRLYRQGQRNSVRVHYLIAKKTLDVVVRNRIRKKDATQDSLFEALREYRKNRNAT